MLFPQKINVVASARHANPHNETVVVQNDTAVEFYVAVVGDNGQTELPEGATYTLVCLHLRKQPTEKLGTLQADGNVMFKLTHMELSETGPVQGQVRVYHPEGGRLTSNPFIFHVAPDPTYGAEIKPEDQSIIEQVIGEGPAIIAEAKEETEKNITERDRLTGAVGGALDSLAQDKADALLEMSQSKTDADESAQTALQAADNADQERDRLTQEVSDKITEVETARTDAEEATGEARSAAQLAIDEADAARLQKVEVADILGAGPVASVNGKTGVVDGLATQESVNQVTAQLAETVVESQLGGLQPQPLTGVSITTGNPGITDIFDDFVWATLSGVIYRRPLEGGEWQEYTKSTPSNTGILRMLKTNDGEILLVYSDKVYKSSGWSSSPANLTWQEKITANGLTYFLRWSIDGNGMKFIATSYAASDGFADSRYVRISLDAGDTWQIVYDSVAVHGAELANNSHCHSVAYDDYSDRFYYAEGHGEIAGVYVSADDGETWVRPPGMIQNPAPTTMTVTPAGLVCGSDNSKNGLYGVVRNEDFMKEELVQTWRWETKRDGLIGFAQRGYYDPYSGLVYVAFRSNFPDVKPVIAAGTPTSGGLVYTWDSGGVGQDDRVDNILIPNRTELIARGRAGAGSFEIKGKISPPGVNTSKGEGNLNAGVASHATSLALGIDSKTDGSRSLAIGVGAKSEGTQNGIAIGNDSLSRSANSVAIGSEALSSSNSVAIGEKSNASVANSITIGRTTEVSGGGSGVAIGDSAKSRAQSVSIGANAVSVGGSANTTAIGFDTSAHLNSIAIGSRTKTTTVDQFAFGKRHMEFDVLDTTVAGTTPSGKMRFFARVNSSGKIEFCAQFPNTNNPVVIATQP